jgi:hypothetical protein
VIDGAHSVRKGGNRLVVGEVDNLSGDVTAAVVSGQVGLIPSGHDDARPFGLRHNETAGAIPLPRPTTTTVLSCNVLPTTAPQRAQDWER